MWDTLQQLIRIIMQIISGYLIARGVLDEANAVALSGAVLSLANIAWWAYWNRKR